MKNLFYVLAAGFLLASCTKDATCTCTFDLVEGEETALVVVTETSDIVDYDTLEASCEVSDAIAGVTCVLD